MSSNETISILYNNCYGGFSPSKKAITLYNKRMKKINKKFVNLQYLQYIERHDPILVQIFKEIGKEFDTNYSCTKLHSISKKYEKYYFINEYDGMESVLVDKNSYILDNIKSILKDTNMSNNYKIEQINAIISQ